MNLTLNRLKKLGNFHIIRDSKLHPYYTWNIREILYNTDFKNDKSRNKFIKKMGFKIDQNRI